MHASNAELETLACKAAVGAGLPMGLAEEVGVAAAWLSMAGFDGADITCRAIENSIGGKISLMANCMILREEYGN